MDKSGRRFVVRLDGQGPKAIPARRKNRNTFSQLLTKRKATQMAETKTLTVLPMS
jgi:predicted nucleic-acid-binding protein